VKAEAGRMDNARWSRDYTLLYNIQVQNSCCKLILGGPSWPWSYGSWIYNYLCNQCLSALMLWVRISIRARCTLCDKVCQWLVTGQRFSPGPPVSSTNKTDCHDIVESGVKHHQTNKLILLNQMLYLLTFYFETWAFLYHWKSQK